MNRIKSFIKSQTFRIFLVFLGICFVAYVGYLNQTYIGDNYGGRVNGYDQMSFGEYFNDDIVTGQGRHMSITYWLLHAPLSKLGITYFHHQWVFFAIEIIVMAIAATIFYKVFANVLKQKKLSLPLILVTSFIVVNPFICDSLIYLLPSHPQALLFVALSIYFLAKGKGIKNIALTLLFLTLAVSTYQNYYALFVIIALPLIFIQNKGKVNKEFFKRAAIALVVMALSIVIVLGASKVHCALLGIDAAKSTTFNLSPKWLAKRSYFLMTNYINAADSSFYLFPPYLISLSLIAIAATIVVILARKRQIKEAIVVALMLVFGFFSPVYYGIIADTFYLAPRILPALFASLSICAILLMYYLPKLQKNNYFIGGTLAVTAIIIYCCNTFINDVMITNRVELAELRLVTHRIEKYEAENNTKITMVAVYHRGKGELYHSNINNYAAGNASRDLASTEWSDAGALSTLTGRNFPRRTITNEEYEKYFADLKEEDYTYFDPDARLKFDGETMYWAYY